MGSVPLTPTQFRAVQFPCRLSTHCSRGLGFSGGKDPRRTADPQSCHPSEGHGQTIKGKQKGVGDGGRGGGEDQTSGLVWQLEQAGSPRPPGVLLARTSVGPTTSHVRDFWAAAWKPAPGRRAGC